MTAEDASSDTTDERQRLLAARLAQTGAPRRSPSTPEIPPVTDADLRSLTAGQRSLLFESRRRPGSARYNVCHSHVLPGGTDLDRLAECFRSVTVRHDPLRIAFDEERTILSPEQAVSIRRVSATESELVTLAAQEAHTPIDLDRGPLLRLVLVDLPDDRQGLVTTLHHVSSDAGSMAALWRDVSSVYSLAGPVDGSLLPPQAVSYVAHARWQEGRVSSADLDAITGEVAGWDGCDPGLHTAPPDNAHAPTPSGGYLTQPLTSDLTDAPGRPVSVLLAAWGALLQWYTDEPSPAVGVTISRRDHPATEDLVGFFLSTLPLRVPSPDRTFADMVRETEASLSRLLTHRHVPVAAANASMRARGLAIAEPAAMFVFDEPAALELDGKPVATTVHHNGTAIGPVTLFVRRAGAGWEASLEFDRGVITDAAAGAMVTNYDAMLTALLANSNQPVHEVDPGTAPGDDIGAPIEQPVEPLLSRIAGHALSQPAAVAITSGGAPLTWGELMNRADSIATHLRVGGIGRGDRVAISLPRGADAVAAVLGVLQAGAAYVPVDPEYPGAQRQLILSACAPAATLDAPLMETILNTADDGPAPVAFPHPYLDDPAYVIFTSGSTGTPRGVAVTHRQLTASTLARLQVYGPTAPRFLMVSSFGFDSSVAGLFWTLAAGGELILPTETEVHDVDALGLLAERHGGTHTLMVPSLWDALLRRAPQRLSSLQEVIVAGEACSPSVARRHTEHCPHATLTNEYGPTEATVWSAFHAVAADADTDAPTVPIGRAIPGAALRVADRWGRPRPVDVAGELWIRGTGLTAGYVNDASATADRFVTVGHRASNDNSSNGNSSDGASNGHEGNGGRERWYRSGDRVRANAQQVLTFLGRVDSQLSVGGVRVEPEQIEAVISAVDGVGAAGVALTDRGARGMQLVAFVEPGEHRPYASTAPLAGAVTEACRTNLPGALVPKRVQVIPALPRTAHGKIDRGALQALDAGRAPRRVALDADTATELARMRSLWTDVLGVLAIGDTTDFFHAGGDSLGAFELCLAVEKNFGVEVPISALIESRTPVSFLDEVSHLRTEQVAATPANAPVRSLREVVRAGDDRAPLILLAPGGGHLLGYKPLVDALDPAQPVVGFRLPGADGREPPVRSIEAQADRLYADLAEMADQHPIRMLGLSTGGLLGLELAHRLTRAGRPPELLALGDTIFPGYQDYGHTGLGERVRDAAAGGRPDRALKYVANRVRLRAQTVASRARTTRYERTGQGFSPAAHELYLYEIAGDLARVYEVQPYAGPTVLFSATVTDSARTEEPWSQMLSHLTIISVAGEHDEIIEDPVAVRPLADALQELLDHPGTLER